MRLTITYGEDIFNMEVTDDMEIMNFKAFCSVEANLSDTAGAIKLLCNGQMLEDDTKTLKEYSVNDGDVVIMETTGARRSAGRSAGRSSSSASASEPQRARSSRSGPPSRIDFSSISIPGLGGANGGGGPSSSRAMGPGGAAAPSASASSIASSSGFPEDPQAIYSMLRNSPHERAIIREHNPPLSAALESGDIVKFTEVLQQQRKERADKELERIKWMNADPFDADVQRKIAEEIRLKNVDSNMETAMEYSPESFGQVVMLYIDCMVNGHEVKAFVDSGAQMTIMSQACAERCGIMRLVDIRWAGIAKGVGIQKIIGRVHLGQIQIGSVYLPSSFSILEEQPMDMLLGLDMLKRHQCVIDLKNNELVIGTTGTRTSFLPEAELPEHSRLNRTPTPSTSEEEASLAQAMARSAAEAARTASASPPTTQLERDILTIMESGFSRDQAVAQLLASNGNVDQALAALIASVFSNVKR